MDCCSEDKKSSPAKAIEGMLCYCFRITKGKIQADFKSHGKTSTLDEIKAKMQDPGCFCETSNPSGKCCLAHVKRFIDEQKAK